LHQAPQGDPLATRKAHCQRFRRGTEQFNAAGRFFDAHETWEEIWLQSSEPEKTFLQGIIQIAAAFHHRSRGNPHGALSLLQAALRRLSGFPDTYAGIALRDLHQAAQEWAAALADGQDLGPGRIPRIELRGND
jgi:predicted metal-dependent hydrolase